MIVLFLLSFLLQRLRQKKCDKPTIQFIVEEARDSGIEDVLIIESKNKRSIEDHFDSVPELEQNLAAKGKDKLLKMIKQTTDAGVDIYYIRQPYPNGLGDAIRYAKSFVADEPFVVMLGDDLMYDEVPLSKQLIDEYEKTHASILAVKKVPHDEVSAYGVIDPDGVVSDGLYNVKKFVEKPAVGDAPSDLAIIGRYLLTPEIFDVLDNQKPGKGGEIQLTDAIDTLNQTQRVSAHEFKGERYDVGNKFGYVKTNVEYGLKHPEIKDDLEAYILETADRIRRGE